MPAVYSDTVTSARDLEIQSDGQIGYVSSARRYKENIVPLGDTSWVYGLDPVKFNYKQDVIKNKSHALMSKEIKKAALEAAFNTVGESPNKKPIKRALQAAKDIDWVKDVDTALVNAKTAAMECIQKKPVDIEADIDKALDKAKKAANAINGGITPDVERDNEYGLIAEDVKAVNEDFVFHNDDGDVEGVHYKKLIPILLNEIKALNARLEALEG